MGQVAGQAVMESELDRIRSRYVESLDVTIIELDVLLNAIGTDDSDRVFEAIRYRMHRIAGVGPMLGLARVGELARQIEQALEDRPAAPDPQRTRWVRERLDHLLDEMESCLQGANTAGGQSGHAW